MTDKQIIIDGIDVSECKYFSKYQKIVRNNECIVDIQNACVEEIETKPCRQKHNCYFKNWQRKEQECEKLKDKLNCRFCYPIMKIDDPENFKLCQETDCFRRQLDQLKQTLAEIKEIAENNKNSTLCFTAFESDVIEVNNEPMTAILQKINEVEDVENN